MIKPSQYKKGKFTPYKAEDSLRQKKICPNSVAVYLHLRCALWGPPAPFFEAYFVIWKIIKPSQYKKDKFTPYKAAD